jgi:hypothetical protein
MSGVVLVNNNVPHSDFLHPHLDNRQLYENVQNKPLAGIQLSEQIASKNNNLWYGIGKWARKAFNQTIGKWLPSSGISDCASLQNIQNDLQANYQLVHNIDCSDTKNWNNGMGFVPIGNDTSPFTGAFEGNGHVISGLYINRTDRGYLGLFGYTTGLISNVGLTGVSITAGTNADSDYVGMLAGKSEGGISKVSSAGEIQAYSYAGGLVGFQSSTGTITDSHSSVNLTTTSGVQPSVGCGL